MQLAGNASIYRVFLPIPCKELENGIKIEQHMDTIEKSILLEKWVKASNLLGY